jgi:hypothetical protein
LETKQIGNEVLMNHLQDIANKRFRERTRKRLEEIEKGSSEVYEITLLSSPRLAPERFTKIYQN